MKRKKMSLTAFTAKVLNMATEHKAVIGNKRVVIRIVNSAMAEIVRRRR